MRACCACVRPCSNLCWSVLVCVDVWWSGRFGLGGTGRSGAWLLQGPTEGGEDEDTVLQPTGNS